MCVLHLYDRVVACVLRDLLSVPTGQGSSSSHSYHIVSLPCLGEGVKRALTWSTHRFCLSLPLAYVLQAQPSRSCAKISRVPPCAFFCKSADATESLFSLCFFTKTVVFIFCYYAHPVVARVSLAQPKTNTPHVCLPPAGVPHSAQNLRQKNRSTHKRYRKKGYTDAVLNRTITICRPCHSAVHRTHDATTLAESFTTPEELLADETIGRFVAWARKQRTTSKEDSRNNLLRYRR